MGWMWRSGHRPDEFGEDLSDAAQVLSADALAAADPDDILVDFVDNLTAAQIANIGRTVGITFVPVSDQSMDERFYRAHVAPADRDTVLAALSRRADVEIAEPDATISLIDGMDLAQQLSGTSPPDVAHEGYPNDPKYKYQWHFSQIGLREAWKLADGGGTVVAVLDTGVAYENHDTFHQLPDLAGITFVSPYDFVDNDPHANDDHGHGSHVTGTIAQATNNGVGVAGIARNVSIMPLKVLSGSGGGSVAGIADAIRYAADNGAKVINMSLGGPFPSRVLKAAVAYAHQKGVVVVAAAGNESRGRVGYPAAYPGVIAVAATQFDQKTTFYSNYGKAIDIAAPGGNVRVDQNGDGQPDGVLQNTIVIGDPTRDDYFAFMGTSMASPHVAGVAALIVGEGITDPARVEAILQETSSKPSAGYSKDRYGAGILDANAAVAAARGNSSGHTAWLALLLAGATIAGARRRGLGVNATGGGALAYGFGATMGATGVAFLPRLLPDIASMPGVELLTRGLPSWDISLLGPTAHGNPLFFSVAIPLALLSLAFGRKSWRLPLAGLLVGVSAHLLAHAVMPGFDVRFVPSVLSAEGMWLIGNAVVGLFLAQLALRK